MTARPHEKALSQLLRLMADTSPISGVDTHREALLLAADVVDDVYPRAAVMVTNGWDVDPVVAEVGYMLADVERIHDDVAVLTDRVAELKRLLVQQTKASDSGSSADHREDA